MVFYPKRILSPAAKQKTQRLKYRDRWPLIIFPIGFSSTEILFAHILLVEYLRKMFKSENLICVRKIFNPTTN